MQEVYMVVDKMPSALIVVSFIAMYLVSVGLIKLAWLVLNIKD